MPPPLAAILIYAVAAAAQWQGHGSRARHAALDAALTAYPEIHARETEKLKNGDPGATTASRRTRDGRRSTTPTRITGPSRSVPGCTTSELTIKF